MLSHHTVPPRNLACMHHENLEKMREPMFPANLLLLLLFFFFFISFAIDILTPSHPLSNGEILISKNGTFALGFFTPPDSSSSYIGIWFHNQTDLLVWVANRGDPIYHINTTILTLTAGDASLQLVTADNQTDVIWSSPSFPNSGPNPIAQLLDTGNLVIKAPNSTSYLWQSFDYPTDTLLPGMKLGPDLKTGADRNLTAWTYGSDPSPGRYVLAIDPNGLPQLVIRDVNSGRWTWRARPWNGHDFSFLFKNFSQAFLFPNKIINLTQEDNYISLNKFGDAISRLTMNPTGAIAYACFEPFDVSGWIYPSSVDDCEYFSKCGINAICDRTSAPICHCLDGFIPMNRVSWDRGDWSDGCVRVAGLDCEANGTDEFILVNITRLPDTSDAMAYESLGLEGCKTRCLMNCSCKAYASSVRTGCIIWMAAIKDLKIIADERPQDLYVRISSSPNGFHGLITRSKKKPWWVFVVTSVSFGLLIVIILLCALKIRRRKHKNEKQPNSPKNWDRKIMHELDVGREGSPEISFFKFSHVVSATDNFSDINKLGQGGFGPVYKGRLVTGQVIAIKRLSARSRQGLEEFKNEILLIAKLRHRNLVRLLGCCIDGEEKMLIYEFMPNKSLDILLFNVEQKSKLDWATRFQIIEGIAHGLFYLHKHSILRIIHRDLKASNILLDADMNPKISDFGMARIFDSNDTEVNTRRIVGTFGYMSPEYVSKGRFSIKSDVFSFGVLLLEIVSGKRNNDFREYDSWCNLLEYAWDLWKKGNWMEIVDPSLDNNFQNDQMARCIYVALLCVQERPEDRPGISDVIAMLGNENLYFNIIKQPAFITVKNTLDSEWPENQHVNICSNGLTISTVKGR